jgi:hypothetical protein
VKRELAIALLDARERLGPGINEVDALARQIEDPEERSVYLHKFVEVVAIVGYDLVMHIVRQYPDLDPDK